ncbi:MAG TPA: hypothetical protein VM070_07345 [Candidatus Saccharimonadales bacterium]|nr:hypothetical protein [Candidatus Saccharimonadales bacterium]
MADRRRCSPPASTAWTPKLAYAVGLLATDGCQADGRHLAFPSADRELVESLLHCLGKTNRIATARTRIGGTIYRTQIGDVALCRWLLGIGITPRKSLTLGPIAVPDELILACARGLLDGDGSISSFVHAATKKRYPEYQYERLVVSFHSASRAHLEWLRIKLEPFAGGPGWLSVRPPGNGRHEYVALRYGKREGLRLLPWLYRDTTIPKLERKYRVWQGYLARHGDPASAIHSMSSPT